MMYYKYLKYKNKYLLNILSKYQPTETNTPNVYTSASSQTLVPPLHDRSSLEKDLTLSPQNESNVLQLTMNSEHRISRSNKTITIVKPWYPDPGIREMPIMFYTKDGDLIGEAIPPCIITNTEHTDSRLHTILVDSISLPAFIMHGDRNYDLIIRPLSNSCYINMSDLTHITKLENGMEITGRSPPNSNFNISFQVNDTECIVTMVYIRGEQEHTVTATFTNTFTIGRFDNKKNASAADGVGSTKDSSKFCTPEECKTTPRNYIEVSHQRDNWFLSLHRELVVKLGTDIRREETPIWIRLSPDTLYNIYLGFSPDRNLCLTIENKRFGLTKRDIDIKIPSTLTIEDKKQAILKTQFSSTPPHNASLK